MASLTNFNPLSMASSGDFSAVLDAATSSDDGTDTSGGPSSDSTSPPAASTSAAGSGSGVMSAASVPSTVASASSPGAAVVADAQQYLGVPYVWGGTDPSTGLDCSGLVQRVYADLGVSMPRVAADQATMGVAVPNLASAQPGDLVSYGSPAYHIGIYIGDGKMIDAPHTGASVEIDPVGTPTSIRRILTDPSSSSDLSASSLSSVNGATGRPAGLGMSSYMQDFVSAGATYGVPSQLLAAVAQTESNYNPTAVSSAGAEGLMQFMPGTAAGLGIDPWDPSQAIQGAAKVLSQNHSEFGSWPLAVAAYNAGSGAVQQYGGIPPYPETENYVTKVLGLAGMGASQ
jgi:cell wall-associated NlpC family hydrolase